MSSHRKSPETEDPNGPVEVRRSRKRVASLETLFARRQKLHAQSKEVERQITERMSAMGLTVVERSSAASGE